MNVLDFKRWSTFFLQCICVLILFLSTSTCAKPRGRIRATCAPDEILILFYLGLGFCFAVLLLLLLKLREVNHHTFNIARIEQGHWYQDADGLRLCRTFFCFWGGSLVPWFHQRLYWVTLDCPRLILMDLCLRLTQTHKHTQTHMHIRVETCRDVFFPGLHLSVRIKRKTRNKKKMIALPVECWLFAIW